MRICRGYFGNVVLFQSKNFIFGRFACSQLATSTLFHLSGKKEHESLLLRLVSENLMNKLIFTSSVYERFYLICSVFYFFIYTNIKKNNMSTFTTWAE
jgi:hypothetical protein